VGNENPFLNSLISLMHSVKILPYIENGKSTWEFNGQHILRQFLLVPSANLFIVTNPMIAMDLCVWDPGICFEFMALTDFTDNKNEVLLLGCTGKLFLNADSHSMSRVWDPGQPLCVHCYLSNGSCVIYNYIAIPCPSITYKLIIDTYYVINLGVLVANFERTSVWRHDVNIILTAKLRSATWWLFKRIFLHFLVLL